MGDDQMIDYLFDDFDSTSGSDELEVKHDEQKWDEPVRPSAEHDRGCPINARYGGDELWSSKRLNAGTDIVREELWDNANEGMGAKKMLTNEHDNDIADEHDR